MQSLRYVKIAKAYAEAMVAGDIPACRWVKLACQRQLNDLAGFKGKASPYRFNPNLTDGKGRRFYHTDNLCAFIERLPHVKGPLAGTTVHYIPFGITLVRIHRSPQRLPLCQASCRLNT